MTADDKAREIYDAITKQNWKHGGVLTMDVPEGVAMIAAALEAARAEALEEAAKIIEAESERVLACQTPHQSGFYDSVNINLRMTTVLLPSLAAAIRARKAEKETTT